MSFCANHLLIAFIGIRAYMSSLGTWRDGINDRRKGAGYFLTLKGDPSFKPADYIKYRAVQRDQSLALIEEWSRWMIDLQKSPHEVMRRAAVAPALTQNDLDEYYQDRVSVDREQDALESSRRQLRAADGQLTSRIQKRQGKSNRYVNVS